MKSKAILLSTIIYILLGFFWLPKDVLATRCAQVQVYVVDLDTTTTVVPDSNVLLHCAAPSFTCAGETVSCNAGPVQCGQCWENSGPQSVGTAFPFNFGNAAVDNDGYDCFVGNAKLEVGVPAGWTWQCTKDGSKNDCSAGGDIDINNLNLTNGAINVVKVFYKSSPGTPADPIPPSDPAPSPVNAATCTALFFNTAPIIAGLNYTATVKMENAGTTTWTGTGGYKLGAQQPPDDPNWGTATGADSTLGTRPTRVTLPSTTSPGNTATFSNFPVTAPNTAGDYRFSWQMVQDGTGGQWFGGMCAPNITVSPAVQPPTLFADNCTGTPNPGQTGQNITWNVNNISGGTGTYTYSWSGTDGLSGTTSDTTTTSNSVNKTYTAVGTGTKDATVTISSGTAPSITKTCSITITAPGPGVDLTAENIILNSGTLEPGSTVTFRGTIRNNGSSTAGGTFYNRFQIDLNSTTFSTADVTLTPDPSLTALAGGATANVISGNFSSPPSSGTHTVRLCADTDSASNVSESSETNNCITKSFIFSCPPPPAAGAFDYSLSNSGNITVTAGSSGSNSINANLLGSLSGGAPSFRSVSPKVGVIPGDSFTIAIPTGVIQDDLLLAVITTNTSNAFATVTPPNSCWTQILQTDSDGGANNKLRISTFRKFVGPSEPTTYQWTFNQSYAVGTILAYSGVDGTTPINASGGQSATSSPTSISTPSINTTSANTRLVVLTANNAFPITSTPTGLNIMTTRYQYNNPTYGPSALGADAVQSSAGSTGQYTSTVGGSSALAAQILALNPVQSSSSQNVTLSILSGLPQGATSSFPLSCFPTCSRTLNITTAASTLTATYPITVAGSLLSRTTDFNLIVQPPPIAAPTISTANIPNSCINPGYSGSGVTISWSSVNNPGVTWVDIDTDAAFAEPYYHKNVTGLTSTTAPSGFGAFPSGGTLDLNPNTTYYVRTFNGTTHSPTASFNIPACLPGPFSQSNPQAKCSATSPFSPYVDLSWGTSVNTSSYQIFRNLAAIATVTASQTTYRDASVTAAISYSYLIRAANSGGFTDSDGGIAKSVTTLICTPWIKTEGGDVHSNTNINTPGGP